MSSMSLSEKSRIGFYVGMGIALVPVGVTSLIASSKIIFINVIANTILRVISAGTLEISIHEISFVQVPLLWQISKISAIFGGSIAILSVTIALANDLRFNKKISRIF